MPCQEVLKNAQPKKLAWFDKIQDAYGRSLEKALKNRFIPLAAAVLLLVFCHPAPDTDG